MCIIGLVVSFLEYVSMLESNLICESYECFNEGVSVASQITKNDFASE